MLRTVFVSALRFLATPAGALLDLCLAKSHLSRSRLIFSDEADTLPASC